MGFGQSVRKFVRHTILRRPLPDVGRPKKPDINPLARMFASKHARGRTMPFDAWRRKKNRRIMTRESRRGNRA